MRSINLPPAALHAKVCYAKALTRFRKLIRVEQDDVVLGILPFFRAFSYSATRWVAWALDMAAVYHFDAFGTSTICEFAKKYRVTTCLPLHRS